MICLAITCLAGKDGQWSARRGAGSGRGCRSRMLADLGAPASSASLVSGGYAMFFGGLLMLGARLGDRFGHRRTITASLAVFAAGALLGAVASSVVLLAAARCLQGAAAAASVPSALRLLTTLTADGPQRRRAIVRLRMLAHDLAGAPVTSQVIHQTAQETSAIVAAAKAGCHTVLAPAADGRPGAGHACLLRTRLARLEAAAADAVAAARDNDTAALRQHLGRFDALTAAIWAVLPAASTRAEPRTQGGARVQLGLPE